MMKTLYLSQNPALIEAQLQGQPCSLARALPLRDDVSTDEITPVAILSHYDAKLGDFAHTGLRCAGVNPVARGQLRASGFEVLVAGQRYGKGSSREHSPTAERLAGIRLVFAQSFERIYRQNADNIGLWTSTNFALLERIERGEVQTLAQLLPELLAEREGLAASILQAGGLLHWGQQHLQTVQPVPARIEATRQSTTAGSPRSARDDGLTLFEKILSRHLLHTPATPEQPQTGDGVFVQADWRFIHEYYTGMADTLLQGALGEHFALQRPEQIVVFEDHTSYVEESPAHVRGGLIPQMRLMQHAQRDFAARHGLRQHRTLTDDEAALDDGSNVAGISHAIVAEHYALPGQVVAGTDSHTPHSGALGCVAFGLGTTDMANAFVTGAVRMTWPENIRVNLRGTLPTGVTAKDLLLHLLALPLIRGGAGVGKVFEFTGEGITKLSTDERATLTNMTAELGGLSGIIAPDEETVRFLRERRGLDFELQSWMRSDVDAHYAHTLDVDLHQLSPMVARPGDPGQGLTLAELVEPVRIDIAYGGSCTAGKREDFEHYHAVLAWGYEHGLRIPAHVQVFLQYGTTAVRDHCIARGFDKLFKAMGIRILQPSCGACANCGPGSSTDTSQVTVSAINRNFPGRSGPGKVWLASPLTVMASALAGELMSWDSLKQRTLSQRV
jgi:3-isopropylmalate/(R)-2-methylmalate dehydratase large subunit